MAQNESEDPVNNVDYNLHMKNVIVCFCGFKDKEQADHILNLVRALGGSSRKDVTQKVTHLIAKTASGSSKYRSAVLMGIPIMTYEWVEHIWDKRFDSEFNGCAPQIIAQFRLKPFVGLFLSFVQVSKDELDEMEELTIQNGGYVVQNDDPRCTHFVIDAIPGESVLIDFDYDKHQFVVYKEWFWASIQNATRSDENAEENAYPLLGAKNSKRKSSSFRQSINSNDILSPNLDCSSSLDQSEIMKTQCDSIKKPLDLASLTARHKICLELLQTEKNYVNVLNTIIKVFKEPLEQKEFENILLDDIEIKVIFGYLPPILDVHSKILFELELMLDKWNENNQIGKIFAENSKAFVTSYPPYINFFEKTKEMIIECDNRYPRFHAFLKRCQSKPECGRQSLQELLIRPVQRLPSVVLLLQDLLKKTENDNPDYNFITKAIEQIKFALDKINEDKRKTECQLAMFEIIHGIDDCPPTLLSAQRKFIAKIDVKLLTKNEDEEIIAHKNVDFTIFLFTDLLEFCKKRTLKRTNSLQTKSDNKKKTISNSRKIKKSFKHLKMIYFPEIKSVQTISKGEEGHNSFVLTATAVDGLRSFRIFPFVCHDKETTLNVFLNHLSEQLEVHHPNPEVYKIGNISLKNVDFTYILNFINELNKSKFALKTKEKLNRAFSFRRQSFYGSSGPNINILCTPPAAPSELPSPQLGRRLSRAFSQLFSSSTNLNNLREQRNLGSMTSLNENVDPSGTFSLPSTPAPRKKKCPNI